MARGLQLSGRFLFPELGLPRALPLAGLQRTPIPSLFHGHGVEAWSRAWRSDILSGTPRLMAQGCERQAAGVAFICTFEMT